MTPTKRETEILLDLSRLADGSPHRIDAPPQQDGPPMCPHDWAIFRIYDNELVGAGATLEAAYLDARGSDDEFLGSTWENILGSDGPDARATR